MLSRMVCDITKDLVRFLFLVFFFNLSSRIGDFFWVSVKQIFRCAFLEMTTFYPMKVAKFCDVY